MRAQIAAVFAMALLAIALHYAAPALAQQPFPTIGSGNYTSSAAKTFIASAYNYVNAINQSGYLIFMPNLTLSYKYLDDAESMYNSSPGTAVIYASKAISAARLSYQRISYYKAYSLVVLTVFTVAVGIILYRLMKPIKQQRKRRM